jgi:hypothetical protein
MEQWWKNLQGKSGVLREKRMAVPLSKTNLMWTSLELNPGSPQEEAAGGRKIGLERVNA